MKTRKSHSKARRRRNGQPLRAQILLYRDAVKRLRARYVAVAKSELPIDDEMISES